MSSPKNGRLGTATRSTRSTTSRARWSGCCRRLWATSARACRTPSTSGEKMFWLVCKFLDQKIPVNSWNNFLAKKHQILRIWGCNPQIYPTICLKFFQIDPGIYPIIFPKFFELLVAGLVSWANCALWLHWIEYISLLSGEIIFKWDKSMLFSPANILTQGSRY